MARSYACKRDGGDVGCQTQSKGAENARVIEAVISSLQFDLHIAADRVLALSPFSPARAREHSSGQNFFCDAKRSGAPTPAPGLARCGVMATG